jgi:hypothetical protein
MIRVVLAHLDGRALAPANASGLRPFRLRHPTARNFHYQVSYLEGRTDALWYVDEVGHSQELVEVASRGGRKGHNTLVALE